MIVEKYSAFRKGSAARSHVTTRVHSARRSQREPAGIPARTSGREQPSGPGSGSTPCTNRGVAHAPADSPGCERRTADGTKRRPPERARYSLEVAGAVTDPTVGLRLLLARVFRAMVVIQAPVFDANHRGLSRLPSRRQPFPSEPENQCEEPVEKSLKSAPMITRRDSPACG